ncbi:UNVERIFIED_CONTAM: hypothetical protein FKN15_018890 [Acipenser sinensis]
MGRLHAELIDRILRAACWGSAGVRLHKRVSGPGGGHGMQGQGRLQVTNAEAIAAHSRRWGMWLAGEVLSLIAHIVFRERAGSQAVGVSPAGATSTAEADAGPGSGMRV